MARLDLTHHREHRVARHSRALACRSLERQTVEPVRDRRLQQPVPRRVELDLVDPVAEPVVRTQLRRVLVRQHAEMEHLGRAYGATELGDLARNVWSNAKSFIEKSASGESTVLQHHLANVFVEAGRTLAADSELRTEINDGLVVVLRSFIAEQKSGVSTFIADQVKSWDMTQLISLIEVNVGKDLQYIRFNGTLIGGLVGLALHTIEVLLRLA